MDPSKLSLMAKIKVLISNQTFVLLLFASFFRFWAGYSLGLLSAHFFENRWPSEISNISITQAITIIGGGLPASIAGGYISDRFESTIPHIRGLISGLGALIAVPFIFITFIIQPDFWVSIVSYFIAYFAAEMWFAPARA